MEVELQLLCEDVGCLGNAISLASGPNDRCIDVGGGPPKVDQDISTLDSVPTSWSAGMAGSDKETHSAQRQSTFQFLIPVRRLSVVSWVLARSSTRIVSTNDDLLIEVAHHYGGACLGLVEIQQVLDTDTWLKSQEVIAHDLLVGRERGGVRLR